MKNLLFSLIFLPLFSNAQIINTFAGSIITTYGGDGGPGTSAFLDMPAGIALDASGNRYIADQGNNRIRMVNASGAITTIAGNGVAFFGGDGAEATAAELNGPSGVTVDVSGNIYIADQANNRIRKINTSGIISTIAGTGTPGALGDGMAATAAELNGPSSVAVDATGSIYIADQTNGRIRKITGGVITTIAGAGGAAFTGDGGLAIDANFHNPAGVSIDASGNIYIADELNARIRKVNTAGIISTIAGNGTFGYSGDGGAATSAELWQPTGVTTDAAGNVYIADLSNNRVRKINTSGIISTLTGNGLSGFSGDGGIATAAVIFNPSDVAIDATGNLYFTDMNNSPYAKFTDIRLQFYR